MSQAEIGNLLVRLSVNTAEFAAGVKSAQGALSSLGNSIKAFALGAGAVNLFSASVQALHDVADLGDVAESIGITAEQLQAFQRMALASGTSTEMLVKGLQSIAEQSVQANSALSQLFTANGVTTKGKTMNEIILTFMELLKNARTPAEQLAMTTGVLGDKVGRQLVEALRAGSDGWQEEFEKMKQSGNFLADASVADAQRIETAYNQMIANISTGWQRMVVGFAKGLEDVPKNIPQQRYIPGRGPDFRLPVKPNMGPMGGPGQFPAQPVKISILPPDKSNTEKVKKDIVKAVTPPPVEIDTSTWDRAAQIIEETMSPLERYRAALRDLNDVYNSGAITSEVYDRAVKQLQDDFTEAVPAANALNDAFQQIGTTISDSIGYALQDLISGTMSVKDAFRSMAQSISQQLAQLASELIKSSILKVLQIMLGSAGGAGFSFGGMTFGGLYADGGTLGSGKWGIAGEAGPELVKGPASITPMDKLAGGQAPQMNVTVINNSSAAVQTRKNSKGDLEVMIEEVMADKLLRGGNKVDAALQRGFGLRRAGR